MKVMKGTVRIYGLNQSGMSLTEVLVAAALLVIVVYAASKLILSTSKQAVLMTVKEDASSLTDELKAIANSPACGIFRLEGADASIPVPNDFFSDPNNIVSLNGPVGSDGLVSGQLGLNAAQRYGKLLITRIEIAPRLLLYTRPPTRSYIMKTPQIYFGRLRVEYQNTTGTAEMTTGILEVGVDVVLYLDSAQARIINCTSLEQVAGYQEACSAFGGVWDQTTMSCDLEILDGDGSGIPRTCPMNDVCGADPQFIKN